MLYLRDLQKYIEADMFSGKVIILYGARQVGKTTLAKILLEKYAPGKQGLYFDCQSVFTHEFITPDPDKLKAKIGDALVVVFDEAQYVPEIGLALKVFHDKYPKTQIIATGSSAFGLANKIGDSMAGRTREYTVYPLSLGEIIKAKGPSVITSMLEHLLRFGLYPGILGQSDDKKIKDLDSLQSNVLYKDILSLDGVKKPKLLVSLLKLLALRIGSEISLTSLANDLRTTVITVDRYIDVLEKMFIIKRLYALSNNPGVEVRKGFKIYFVDLGIRNSIISSYNPLDIRNDVGPMFENFFVLERIKQKENHNRKAGYYFWRTLDKNEIDYVEEFEGSYVAFECKWQERSIEKNKAAFTKLYPNSKVLIATPKNIVEHILY